MKPLKEHILEGILDIEDNINIDTSDMTKDVIKEFLKENYNIVGSYIIKYIKRNFISKFIIDVKGNISVKNESISSFTNELFEFGSVSGDFYCTHCRSLKSLKGGPTKVGRDFNCHYCESLKSLEGAPEKVGRDFSCSYCGSLTSLKGAPKEVGAEFYCRMCKSLQSLEGAPRKVENFKCSNCISLKTLEGGPKKVEKNFDCSCCNNLTSLKGAPQKVGFNFWCYDCGTQFTEEDVRKYTNVIGKINI